MEIKKVSHECPSKTSSEMQFPAC